MDRDFLVKLALSEHHELSEEELRRKALMDREVLKRPLVGVDCSTPARVAGALETLRTIKQYLLDRAIEAEVCQTGCVGLNSEEPVVSVQMPGRTRLFFGKITAERVSAVMDDLFHDEVPRQRVIGQIRRKGQEPWAGIPFLEEHPFFSVQKRVVMEACGMIDPGSLEAYVAGGGYSGFLRIIRDHTFQEVCELVEKSGLRGRGGGGYPTGLKWKAAYDKSSDQKYLICNAEESDPGAFMDRTLMEGNPFQLLEGVAIAAYAIGSSRAYIYIRSEYEEAVRRITHAILVLREAGWLGDNIQDSGYNLQISLRKGPGAFVCGEETALIASLEGRRGMPSSKPPYPTAAGYLGRPTVVNNVETLSNLPYILRKGPDWYRSIGLPHCAGTKLFSISGRARITGLVEVPMGTTYRTIIQDMAGGVKKGRQLKAIHVGGPAGCVVPPRLMNIPISYENLKSKGLVMGSGGILVLDDQTCVIDTTRYFMEYVDMQSCGKCIPCREGTRRMAEILGGMTGKSEGNSESGELERFRIVVQLEELSQVMRDTSLCGLGQNAPNPVVSALTHFRKEFEEHLFDRHCSANQCKALRSWFIDVDLCTGCSLCAKRCPAEAIIGTPKHPYFIVQEKCIGCGICHEVCKFTAVYYQ